MVAAQAEVARTFLDDTMTGTAEQGLPDGWPQPDCVIFADVLEHTLEPAAILATWREALAPGGHVVISLPNVLHATVVGGLFRGRWDYEDAGVLDRTHFRFFTRATAAELITDAGFEIESFTRAPLLFPRRKLWKRSLKLMTKWRRWRESKTGTPQSTRANLLDIATQQYLIRARKI